MNMVDLPGRKSRGRTDRRLRVREEDAEDRGGGGITVETPEGCECRTMFIQPFLRLDLSSESFLLFACLFWTSGKFCLHLH